MTAMHHTCLWAFPVLLLGAPLISNAEETLDLPQAIGLALERNMALAHSALSVGSSAVGVEEARARFGFKLFPDGAVGSTDGDTSASAGLSASRKFRWGTEVGVGPQFASTVDTNGNNIYENSLRIEIRQPLLGGFGSIIHTEPIAEAESQLASARRLLELDKADLVVAVAQVYLNILKLDLRMRSEADIVDRLRRLHKLTVARETRGDTTRVDSLRTALQLGQVEADLDADRSQRESQMKELAELMGVDMNTPFTLARVPLIETEIPGIEEAVGIALSNRLDLAQVIHDAQDADRGVRINRKKLWPDLKLVLRYDRRLDHSGDLSENDTGEDIWFVGLSTGSDLLRSQERLSLKQAIIDREAASVSIDVMSLAIARQVNQHVLAHRRGLEQVRLAERNLQLAEARRNLARTLFEMGRGDNFSVTDAENAYLTAEDNLLSCQVEETMTTYRLRRVMGVLIDSPGDLKRTLEETYANEVLER